MSARLDGKTRIPLGSVTRWTKIVGIGVWVIAARWFRDSQTVMSGPAWLLGRGETPDALAWMSIAFFACSAVAIAVLPGRLPRFLAPLLLPAWLACGIFLRSLADW